MKRKRKEEKSVEQRKEGLGRKKILDELIRDEEEIEEKEMKIMEQEEEKKRKINKT